MSKPLLNRHMRRGAMSGTVLRIAVGAAALSLALVLVLVQRQRPASYLSEPIGVMGTTARMTIVASGSVQPGKAFGRAVDELRRAEAAMSVYIGASSLSRLNAAPAGQDVDLSAEMIALLQLGRSLADQTRGAFDVTCLPIIRAWKAAALDGHIPDENSLAAAANASGWDKFDVGSSSARKLVSDACIDLGGIAKGYAIDLATESILASGYEAGLVDVGGDIRCFGMREDGSKWKVGIQSPFDDSLLATIALTDAAVCTSGNYRRFSEIGGKKYSHIVDPRTGWPAEATPSVTVIAPTATIADAWATALSVLGEGGLALLPPDSGIEAALVLGQPDDYTIVASKGFPAYFTEKPESLAEEARPR